METSEKPADALFLGAEAKIRLPNVDEALDIGHAIHGADDPALRDTYSQALAQKIVGEFIGLEATPNTPEVPYLRSMKSIARGYGRALTREKERWIAEIKLAKTEREDRENKIRGTRFETQGISAMGKFLWPLLFGLVGYLLAHVLGLTVFGDFTGKTGTSIPSIIASLAFILVSRMVSRWWYDRNRDRIIHAYESRLYLAEREYKDSQRREFQFWRKRGCEAWEEYTGEQYPERASYMLTMEGEMATRRNFQENILLNNKTDLQRLQEALKDLGTRIIPKRRIKTPALERNKP